MKTVIHKAENRGTVNLGWLHAKHSFSFGHYFNPDKIQFGALRVLNDDVVQPKMGFSTHPHDNMEIVTIPLQGALTHKDSIGHKQSIVVNEVQVMSAGTGITHSEFNDEQEDLNILQIWIFPEKSNVTPRYDQRLFPIEEDPNKLHKIVSHFNDDDTDSLKIHQHASFHLGVFTEVNNVEIEVNGGNGIYVFVIDGEISLASHILKKRDAIGIWEADSPVNIQISKNTKLLVIQVPMN